MIAVERAHVLALISVVLSISVILAWVFALVDIALRRDMDRGRKVIYAVVVFLFVPVTLLYLLSRPTSDIRYRLGPIRRSSPLDWRRKLLDAIEAEPGTPPILGRAERAEYITRVEALNVEPTSGQAKSG